MSERLNSIDCGLQHQVCPDEVFTEAKLCLQTSTDLLIFTGF